MGEHTSAPRQPVDAYLADWLARYQPRNIDLQQWSAIRPFVVGLAGRLDLVGQASAARIIRVLTRLAVWCVGEGLPLEVEVVLDPDTVERFVALGLADDRSRATYRAVLRRVGPLLTRRAPWEPRPAVASRRQVALPYTQTEMSRLVVDAGLQPTAARRRAAQALMALGAGAGLDGRWVARVAAGDVCRAGDLVLVRVGEPAARVVPLLARWEDEVRELADSAGDEFLVGGRSTSRNRAGALAASLVVPLGHPRLSAARLRSTWLVHHLTVGTRLPELARAAGLVGVTVLSDLLSFVPAAAPVDADRMLRGVPC
jgi:hypothetical protein